ncbi:hypothetical protein BFG04_02790 [Campylobacter pinnipediorum subsp. pinnipediorum]|uniref:Permease n=1 Tax=Campylobacter pinnipediorum subsp. pinnipediorum TaxID=1660067 RepID=A0AAX0LAL8_9BACT|nr:AEC family transporter [Campylobacter pinnipediorum]OPA78966.1 hypothetical protein BFG04_02790 [Campylobacter pinnipediorum subsp. pinnipediorum]
MIFVPLFSIFVLMASGFLAKKTGVLEQKNSTIFINFVLCFAIPALIFDKMYHVNIDTTLISIIFIGFISSIISAIIGFFICRFFKFSKATTVSVIMLSLFGNTLFVGMPVARGFFGDDILNEVIFYDQMATSIPISIIGPFILSFGGHDKVSLFKNTMKILKFPPFVALVAGIIFKNISISDFLFEPLKLFEASITPVGLFAIGVGLGFASIKSSYKSTAVVLFCKMILPVIVFIVISSVIGLDMQDKTWIVGLMQCSMPPMILAGAMIMKAELDSSLAISSIATGVALSFITLPIMYYIFVM